MAQDGALAALAEKYHLTLVVLFGSRARRRERAGSDTDVAVLGSAGLLPLPALRQLPHELEEATGLPDVDLVDLARASPLLAHAACKHGRALYESTAGTFNVFCVRAWRLYLDDQETLRRLDRKAIQRALAGPP